MIQRVVVAGGGTGGHLFPGLAVVEELRRRGALEVTFVGTARGIESRLLPTLGEKLELVEVSPLAGRAPAELAKSLAVLPRAVAHATRLLRAMRPDLVVGVGGYASGPVLAAAALLRLPTALLEQNAHVGMTNRMLARLVGRAYVTFEETASVFGDKRARVTGNPVRRAFVQVARDAAADPDGFEARAGRSVLVLGGSQGSKALNELVPAALAKVGGALRVVHQTGAAMVDDVRARYASLGVAADVVPFIDDIARAYARSSLVVARAGATTVAELCAIGRASVLVPFPHAAHDHQTKNAETLARAGATVCAPEKDLTPESLAATVASLLDDASRRRTMAEAARQHGRPDAAAAIVDDLCAWLGCAHGANADSDDATGDDASSSGDDVAHHRPLASSLPPSNADPARKRRPRVRTPRVSLRSPATGTNG